MKENAETLSKQMAFEDITSMRPIFPKASQILDFILVTACGEKLPINKYGYYDFEMDTYDDITFKFGLSELNIESYDNDLGNPDISISLWLDLLDLRKQIKCFNPSSQLIAAFNQVIESSSHDIERKLIYVMYMMMKVNHAYVKNIFVEFWFDGMMIDPEIPHDKNVIQQPSHTEIPAQYIMYSELSQRITALELMKESTQS